MKSFSIATVVAVLASVSVQAFPVRADAASSYGSQVNANGLSQLVDRRSDDDPYNGIPETNSLDSEYYEDGRPKDLNAAPPPADDPPADDPPADTPASKTLATVMTIDPASAGADFIAAAAAHFTTTAAVDDGPNALDVLTAAAATYTR